MSESPTKKLSRLFGLSTSQVESVIGTAIDKRKDVGAFCDVYFQAGSDQSLVWDQSTLRSTSGSAVRGAGVRVVIGDKTGYSYTDHVNVTNLRKAARVARAIADYSQGVDNVPLEALEGKAHNLYPIVNSPYDVALADKIALLERMDAEARAYDKRIQNVTISMMIQDHTIVIVNSFGQLVTDLRPMIVLKIQCLAVSEDGKRREQGSSGGGGRLEFSHLLDDDQWKKWTHEAAKQAITNLSSVPAPGGEMTVVLGNGWPGVLIHEAVGHGLEGDFNRKKTSAFSTLLGQKVASDLCTIVDDGTIPGVRGALNIDDEGTPTGRTVLIENGILRGYMQDRTNANLMKTAATGSGRRQDYRYAPIPRMTNTYLAGGQSTRDEIIASVKKGIFAVTFGGGQVDITSGKFTFSATAAFLIEDGKITAPVKGATLIGNGPEALHKISMVGNDMELDQGVGTCGKDGQGVPVCVGMPTVRLDGITVGGTAK